MNFIYIKPQTSSNPVSFLSKTPGIGAYPNPLLPAKSIKNTMLPHLFLTLRSTTVLGCIQSNRIPIRRFSSLTFPLVSHPIVLKSRMVWQPCLMSCSERLLKS